MKNYDREVSMLCPVCGNDQFSLLNQEYEDIDTAPGVAKIQCSDCKSIYTKNELLEANAEIIDTAIEEAIQEIASDLEKDFKKALKKWK